jgi:hypothetical protein
MLRARAAALLPRGPGQARPKSLDTCGPGSGSQCFSGPVVRHPGTPRLLLGSNYWSAVLHLGLTGPGGEPNARALATRPGPGCRGSFAYASRLRPDEGVRQGAVVANFGVVRVHLNVQLEPAVRFIFGKTTTPDVAAPERRSLDTCG